TEPSLVLGRCQRDLQLRRAVHTPPGPSSSPRPLRRRTRPLRRRRARRPRLRGRKIHDPRVIAEVFPTYVNGAFMSDFFLELGKNPSARKLVQTLGLPVPMPENLRRAKGPWNARPLADAWVVVGAGPNPEVL